MSQDIKLIIFSLCLQSAIGIMIFATISSKISKKNEYKVPAILSASLSVIGFLAFVFYLGRPIFIFNTLSQVSHSWLSRALLLSLVFIGLALINVVVQYVNPKDQRFSWIASTVGMFDIFCMVKVYTNTSRLGWQSVNTAIDFLATTVILGIAILLVASFNDLGTNVKKQFGWIGLAAVAILSLTTVLNYLPDQNTHWILVIQILLLIIGTILLFAPSLKKQGEKMGTGGIVFPSLGAASLCVSLIINRYFFYAVLITSNGL